MPAVTKTGYTPNLIMAQANDASTVTGIFDAISVISGTSTDHVTIDITPLGSSVTTVELSSGDTLYGPFLNYKITSAGGSFPAGVTVLIRERSKLT